MLTDPQCRKAKPAAKPYKLKDGKGLYLEVKPNGVKAWRYRFKIVIADEMKESMFAIGEYAPVRVPETPEQSSARRSGGMFSVEEAREERKRARALVKQGINPAHHRQLERIKRAHELAITFEAVAKEWLTAKEWHADTKADRLGMLERVVFPKIGVLPMRQITSAHVLDILKTAAKKNGPTVAAEAKRTISGVFDLAVSTLRAETDPVYAVRKALPKNKTQHKRPLTADEVGKLLRDLDGYERNFQTVGAFRFMWMTLCRPNEVMGARWDEIDLEAGVWIIRAERMKKRKEHRVPLPVQAVALLTKLREFTGHRTHVFPNRDDRDSHMTDATLRQALKYLGWSGQYSPHATRTTGSTMLNEMGFASDWIERQLAHIETDAVRRTYNHADYLHDRARMMQQWADQLDVMREGRKVIVGRFGKAA